MIIRSLIKSIFPRNFLLNIKYYKQSLYRVLSKVNKVNTKYKIHIISEKDTHVFFGYYDISPFNLYTDEIIYLTKHNSEDYVRIILDNCSYYGMSKREIAISKAWNWQQGIRLRWMPNNNRSIVFNDFINNSYCSRIVNVDTLEESILPLPLYDIASNGQFALSLNFERLGVKRPGYGYTCRDYMENKEELNNEAIYIYNFNDGDVVKLLTYDDINNALKIKSNDYSSNYINHISISPCNDRFLFFWLTSNHGFDKASLLVYDFKTKAIIPLEEDLKVSHYAWIDNDNILCTAIDSKLDCHYSIYNIPSKSKKRVNRNSLNTDGHPSLYNNNIILTDTYPDSNGFQRLFLTGIDDSERDVILTIYSDCRVEGEKRTDLHPRLSFDKKIISIDANINVVRSLFLIHLS